MSLNRIIYNSNCLISDPVVALLDNHDLLIVEAPTQQGKTRWAEETFGPEAFLFHERDISDTTSSYTLALDRCANGGNFVIDEEAYLNTESLKMALDLTTSRPIKMVVLTQSYEGLASRLPLGKYCYEVIRLNDLESPHRKVR